MRIAIYSRKSVLTEKGESIENQIELCRTYIFSKIPGAADAEIQVYEDEGFSGGSLERPRFQQLLRDLRRNRFDYLVCYRLDRISRNVGDFAGLIEDLNRRGVSFVCIREEFDTSKPMGKAMMYIASVFAQLERETIAERVRDNMLLLARTGRWLGGTTPTGFVSEQMEAQSPDGKRKHICRLRADKEETAVIRLLYETFLERGSVSGVAKYLMQKGIRSRAGTYYSLPGIKEILQNPVYCAADKTARDYFVAQNADVCFAEADCDETRGLISYQKRDYRTKNAPRQPKDRWIIAIGSHESLFPGRKWVAVQQLLEASQTRPGAPHNSCSLLSGRILCAACGSRMFAKTRSRQPGRFDYICKNKLRGGAAVCSCPNLGGQQTDEMVVAALMPHLNETGDAWRLLEGLKKELRRREPDPSLSALRSQIKKREGELRALVRSLSRLEAGEALLRRAGERARQLEGELISLKARQEQLQDGGCPESGAAPDALFQRISCLSALLDGCSAQEKRRLISLTVEKLLWDGSDLHIFFRNGQGESD